MSIWKRLYCVLGRIHKDSRELKGSSFVFEKSFENLLRKDGILPLQLNGYERHPNGANHYPDFEIYDKRSFLSVELKTSKSIKIGLGQTWIQSDGLYIIRYQPKTFQENPIMISFGNDLKTDKDDELFYRYKYDLLQLRDKYKNVSKDFKLYPYSALEYKIDETKVKHNYEIVMEYLKNK